MICPACGNQLTEMEANGIMIDVCKDGCGGIWFDNREIKKLDEKHEGISDDILLIEPKVKVDLNKKRKCPKCKDVTMMQHFFSPKREVMIDECGVCGGIWLDAGELKTIRNQFSTESEREKAADQFFGDVFGNDMKKMSEISQEKLQKAQKFAKVFKAVCPSAYIKGKQNWGAF